MENVTTVETNFSNNNVEVRLGDADSTRTVVNLTHAEAQELLLQLVEGLVETNGTCYTGR